MRQISNEFYEILQHIARQETLDEGDEGTNPYDASGGNCDDAYGFGSEDGKIRFARRVLADIDKQEKQ